MIHNGKSSLGTDCENWRRFTRQLHDSLGVIECSGPRVYHMLAYDRGRIFDPDGDEFLYPAKPANSGLSTPIVYGEWIGLRDGTITEQSRTAAYSTPLTKEQNGELSNT